MKTTTRCLAWGLLAFMAAAAPFLAAADVSYQSLDDGRVQILIDGELFTQFIPNFAGTPVFWPVLSADGSLLTRSLYRPQPDNTNKVIDGPFPAEDYARFLAGGDRAWTDIMRCNEMIRPVESKDHPHQRSVWFDHGMVNGKDFWSCSPDTAINAELISAEKNSDGQVVLVVHCRWNDLTAGECLCEDTRTVTLGVIPGTAIRFIDYRVDLTAGADPTIFGDTKEGSFGFRVASTMELGADKKNHNWGGSIINDEGLKDDYTCGKRTAWVNFNGKVTKRLTAEQIDAGADIQTAEMVSAGIVIMNHPGSFRFPSWYHVRGYGLFAVNPFGIKDFAPQDKLDGSATLQKGETLTFRYRLLIYDGELSAEQIAPLYEDYAK